MSSQPTEEEFGAACAAAIAPYYDPKLDGPLLVCIRPQAKFRLDPERWETWPEYACAVGYWPEHHNGKDYAQFTQHADEAVIDLVHHVEGVWRQRQPEPEATAPDSIDLLLN